MPACTVLVQDFQSKPPKAPARSEGAPRKATHWQQPIQFTNCEAACDTAPPALTLSLSLSASAGLIGSCDTVESFTASPPRPRCPS